MYYRNSRQHGLANWHLGHIFPFPSLYSSSLLIFFTISFSFFFNKRKVFACDAGFHNDQVLETVHVRVVCPCQSCLSMSELCYCLIAPVSILSFYVFHYIPIVLQSSSGLVSCCMFLTLPPLLNRPWRVPCTGESSNSSRPSGWSTGCLDTHVSHPAAPSPRAARGSEQSNQRHLGFMSNLPNVVRESNLFCIILYWGTLQKKRRTQTKDILAMPPNNVCFTHSYKHATTHTHSLSNRCSHELKTTGKMTRKWLNVKKINCGQWRRKQRKVSYCQVSWKLDCNIQYYMLTVLDGLFQWKHKNRSFPMMYHWCSILKN